MLLNNCSLSSFENVIELSLVDHEIAKSQGGTINHEETSGTRENNTNEQ